MSLSKAGCRCSGAALPTASTKRFFQPGLAKPPAWLDPFGLFGGKALEPPSTADVDLAAELARLRAEMDRLAGLVASKPLRKPDPSRP